MITSPQLDLSLFADSDLPELWGWLALGCALLTIPIWALWLRRRRSAASQPACGRCGYFVTGLSGTVCPECGSDLRTVGVVAPGDARHAPTRLQLAIFALLLPVPIIVGWHVVRPALPKRFIQWAVITLEQPNSGAYRQVRVEGWGHRWGIFRPSVIPLTDVEIRLARQAEHDLYYFIDVGNPVGTRRTVDYGDGRVYRAPLVHHADAVTGSALLDWAARDAGLDRDDPRLHGEMRSLHTLLRAGMARGGFVPIAGPNWSAVSSNGGGASAQPLWMFALWVGLWMLVGLIVARWLRRPALAGATTRAIHR